MCTKLLKFLRKIRSLLSFKYLHHLISQVTKTVSSETKKDEDMEPEETSYIEEIVNPSRNLLQELDEPVIPEGMCFSLFTVHSWIILSAVQFQGALLAFLSSKNTNNNIAQLHSNTFATIN